MNPALSCLHGLILQTKMQVQVKVCTSNNGNLIIALQMQRTLCYMSIGFIHTTTGTDEDLDKDAV